MPTAAREEDAVSRTIFTVLYFVVMAAIIIGVDVLFLRHLFWPRLFTNIGIVVVFALVYLLFLRKLFA